MSQFEYLSVLISIVIALGISGVASAWGRLLRHRARVRFSWLHGFWSLFMVLLMIQFWWGFWEYRDIETWAFGGLLSITVEALVMVMAALVLTPDDPFATELDLHRHYFEHARLFFLLGAAVIAQLAIVDFLVGGQPFWHLENAIRVPGVGVAVLAAWSRSERLHHALAVVAAVLLLIFVHVTFTW
jgi:hypothetical protein